MNLDGKADIGVSTCSSLLEACGFVDMGGAGRAKGLGGPWAPALRRAFAEGEGGGSWRGTGWEVEAGSEVASSPEASLGIWTFSLGRLGSVFVLVGGLITGVLAVRWGG